MKLSVIILTYNEEKHIAACIHSAQWADEIIVFDSFSTDRTVQIAREGGAQVIQHVFVNYSQQREAALQATDAEWVLFWTRMNAPRQLGRRNPRGDCKSVRGWLLDSPP